MLADAPVPSERDRENERTRMEIAARQKEAWVECATWALKAFGAGFDPKGRHFLVTKEEEECARREGGPITPAATVYTVRNAQRVDRHFTVSENGEVVACESYAQGFGNMLLELHETRGFVQNGEFFRTHKYSLCWAGFDLYHPKSAEELAVLRATRERNKAERKDKKFAEEFPLFVLAGHRREDFDDGKAS